MTGAIGERESRRGATPWYFAKHSPFAVLIQETKFNDFEEKLRERKEITHVFLVTDSEDNFALMRREVGRKYSCLQLYKTYLDNFRINTVDRDVVAQSLSKMKLELKDFQKAKLRELHEELVAATEEFARRGKHQGIVFSSPTGSGKTITIAGLLEDLLNGTEDFPARTQMRFLWISHSPELNAQSRNKLLNACDAPSEVGDFELVKSEEFKEEVLQPGRVYFINTQLLGKDKLLTATRGDKEGVTFWQTVAKHGTRSW